MTGEALPQYPTYPTNVQGGIGAIPQPSYGVQQVMPMQGSSGGLVNKGAQIIGGAQAGQNAVNQQAQMDRASTEFQQEQQMQSDQGQDFDALAQLKPGGSSGAPPGKTSDSSGFFSALASSPIAHVVGAAVHALTGAGHTTGGIPAQGSGAPPAAAAAASGPPVAGIPNAPQVAQSAANGGVVTEPEFMRPQPQPVMVGLAKGGVVPAPKPLPSPRTQAFRTRRTNDELNSGKSGVKAPAAADTGAKTGNPRATGFGVTQGSPRGMPGFADGGPIPGYDAGGAIPAPANVAPMQGSSGGLVNTGAQIIGGAQAGQNSTNQQEQMDRAGTEYSEGQAAGHDAQGYYEELVRQHHTMLHGMGLDDTGTRNDTQGITAPAQSAAPPSQQPAQPQGAQPAQPAPQGAPAQGGALPAPAQAAPAQPQAAPGPQQSGTQPQAPASPVQAQATAQAVQTASQDPKAQAGQPETPEAPAHSITAEEYDHLDQLALHAAASAARAGHDGNAVYQALTATKNAWVQGHIIRNLSAASVALQNGDQAGVEKALRDANYYIPNGQDLNIQKDKGGNLVYQDPIMPYLDSGGHPTYASKDPSNGKPNQENMIPVDAAHIQQLGTAFLDPMNVQQMILNTRSSMAAQQLEAQRGQALVMGAQARGVWAQANLTKAQTEGMLVPSEALKNRAGADLDEARAHYMDTHAAYLQRGYGQHMDPSLLKGASAAAGDVMTVSRGKQTPVLDQNGAPTGKYSYDNSQSILKDAGPAEINSVSGMASDIYLANRGSMSHNSAAQAALQIYAAGKQGHYAGKQYISNISADPQKGVIYVWDPKTNRWGNPITISAYGAGRLGQNGAGGMVDDNDPLAMSISAGSSGPGAIPPPSEDGNQAAAEQATEDSEDNQAANEE